MMWMEYNIMYMQTNTFQAVLAANNESSYIIFLYEEGGIQWTTGDQNGGMNGVFLFKYTKINK